jgi:hypothetical protein
MSVTKLDNIKKMAGPKEVELPGWEEEKVEVGKDENDNPIYEYKSIPFVAKLKRASLLGLASKGKIPNQLMNIAQQLFTQSINPSKTSLKDITDVVDIVVQECLVEPSFEEIKDYLTDEQRYAIFSYSQQGLKGLGK